MAVKTYCTYGLYDEDSANSLEEGDSCERFTYWDNVKKVTLEDVTINDIYENRVVIKINNFEEITIQIENIIDWE